VKVKARAFGRALLRCGGRLLWPSISGMTVKPVVCCVLAAGLLSVALPLSAQEAVPAGLLTEVCLPFANRALTLERSVKAARELEFRRPVNDTAPLDEWASEVTMVSRDGVWRVRIEEGSVERDARQAYEASCVISSSRASARELADLGRRAFRDERYWTSPPDNAWRWDRRSAYPDEYGLAVEVREQAGERPTMTVRGSYY